LRWAERRALGVVRRLVVSSPGFISHHFAPQGWRGETVLVENKLWFGSDPPPRPMPRSRAGPWRIGWVGTIRCQPSFDLLYALAEARPELEIVIRGAVHTHAVADFDARVAALPNLAYEGAYTYPTGLAAVYGDLDMVWAQDLWQRGTNSDWLLPNRIYEAGYFGCPCVALAGTETGARVAEDRLGWALPEATPEAFATLLDGLSDAEADRARSDLLAMPAEHFVQAPAEIAAMLGGP
ncbi:MAG: glycosyl transferase, partial [Pseudomonadota bacterium]